MDELTNLRMFVRVVEEGSFSAAARSLGVAPSSVSRQVSQLEGELGARLFHRTTRKQSLRPARSGAPEVFAGPKGNAHQCRVRA